MFGLFNRMGKIGIGCSIAGAAVGTLAVMAGVIVGGIAAGLPAWAIVLICMFFLLFDVGIAAVFFLVFRATLDPEVKRRALLEKGEPAEATILTVTDTGVTVNEIYPVVKVLLEVRPQGRPPYQTETQMLINRMDIPQIQPGRVVPVKIDPRSPRRVAVVMEDEAATPLDAHAAEQMLVSSDQVNEALRQSGAPAQARIMQAQALGIEVNGPNPAMRFVLEVYPANRPAFQAETIAVVAQASIPKYQPDKMVFVKFDPNDTSRVAIDHA
ncbi:MAG: hypothetical protein C4536_11885 [Actinobacteria bacterium]|nr:MAG: hypothetical protein C4536_11885 [Actinomycetota bacterium]